MSESQTKVSEMYSIVFQKGSFKIQSGFSSNSDKKVFKGFFTVLMLIAIQFTHAAEKKVFDWVPTPPSAGKALGDGKSQHVNLPIQFTEIPKKTADKSKYTRKYTIDLEKFNISNKGENPVETAKGINAALQYAKKEKKNYILFPKGTYLIDEKTPIIIDLTDAIIDLNGSTIQINANGLAKYRLVRIVYGAKNLRLTNGKLKGDREKHDYKSVKSDFMGCVLLAIYGGENLEIDNLDISYAAGCGVGSRAGTNWRESGPNQYIYVYTKNFESGAFSKNGEKIKDNGKVRSIKPYDITKHAAEGSMEFGFTVGYMGFPFVKSRRYQACFYTKDMKFIRKMNLIQYKKFAIPKYKRDGKEENAKYVHLEFNQPDLKGTHGYSAFISNLKAPVNVHFHHNRLYKNRSLGFSYCGGQRWIMEDNLFEANGPQAPGYGIDFEDGWLLMQDVVFRNNKFKGNIRGDLVVCGGSELRFEGNEIDKNAIFWPACLSYEFLNNKVNAGQVIFSTRTGLVKSIGNVYQNCKIKMKYDGRGMNNGLYRPTQKNMSGSAIGGEVEPTNSIKFKKDTLLNVSSVTGPYLDFEECDINNTEFIAGGKTRLVRFEKCLIKNSSIHYTNGGDIAFSMQGNKGELKESGKTERKKTIAQFISSYKKQSTKRSEADPEEDDTEGGVFDRENTKK